MTATEIQSYRDLDAWKVAMELTITVYSLARRLPAAERYGICSQMQRAAVSVPANVAEGQAYRRSGRYAHHVRISLGSWGELGTHFELCRRLGYLTADDLREAEQQLARTGQLLHGLLRSVVKNRIAGALSTLALFALPLVGWLLIFAIL